MVDVVYILSENREGSMIQGLLSNFQGVLVPEYYAVYDSVNCPQQKCLIHLMRDLNDEVLKNPLDAELQALVSQFSAVLGPIIDTVDRRGLKAYFLRKHERSVDNFFTYLDSVTLRSELAIKCRQRFTRNREKLFTFLGYDGVPWNNNNAERAVKAFASLRNVISGPSTKTGTDEYLTLLSICKSCEYRGFDFLDFLRSGGKDVSSFSRRGRRPPSVAIRHGG
jgi:hypothetical protein